MMLTIKSGAMLRLSFDVFRWRGFLNLFGFFERATCILLVLKPQGFEDPGIDITIRLSEFSRLAHGTFFLIQPVNKQQCKIVCAGFVCHAITSLRGNHTTHHNDRQHVLSKTDHSNLTTEEMWAILYSVTSDQLLGRDDDCDTA